MSGTGIKQRAITYSNGRSRRSHINEGVLNNPSPTHYNPKVDSNNATASTFPKNERGKKNYD
jgi:hypothetical protein